jgi:poly(A) polymerase
VLDSGRIGAADVTEVEPVIVERARHPISRRDIDPNVLKVLYRLISAGHIAYLVGGGVRDLMMGRRPKDFDVATSAHPNQVRDLFRNSRLIGRRFRLAHVFFGQQNIEVATFRRRSEELAGDDPLIRHDNTFGTPAEDAFRRDFTVNGLFYDPGSFHVIDYIDGVADLQARLIRTIGDPELRMREDPVRMIRAVRFAVKLGFEIEPLTRAAIERNRDDLAKASVPRLVEETYRTLAIAEADRALILLQQLGLLELLLPFITPSLAVRDLEQAPAVRNLAAMGGALARGEEFSRPLILACLFSDYHLSQSYDQARDDRYALVTALRMHGFSKADTEHMRLLLDALVHMATRSRTLRRIVRRPYFAEARRLFDLVAPAQRLDRRALDAFFALPLRPPVVMSASGRRRRRRRGGRGRRNRAAHDNGLDGATRPNGQNHTASAPPVEDISSSAAVAGAGDAKTTD